MEHLRKVLKTLDYFIVKFELISRIEVKWTSKKIGGKFWQNSKKITKSRKKNWRTVEKIFRKFYVKFGEVSRKAEEFQNKFWERLKVKTLEL